MAGVPHRAQEDRHKDGRDLDEVEDQGGITELPGEHLALHDQQQNEVSQKHPALQGERIHPFDDGLGKDHRQADGDPDDRKHVEGQAVVFVDFIPAENKLLRPENLQQLFHGSFPLRPFFVHLSLKNRIYSIIFLFKLQALNAELPWIPPALFPPDSDSFPCAGLLKKTVEMPFARCYSRL